MFLREMKKKGKKYYSIVKNTRVNGKVKQETVKYIGRLDLNDAGNVKRMLDILQEVTPVKELEFKDIREIEALKSSDIGDLLVLDKAWRYWKLTNFIRDTIEGISEDDLIRIKAMVYHRCSEAGSKLSLKSWYSKVLGEIYFGLPISKVSENKLYSTMDLIETQVFQEKLFMYIQSRFPKLYNDDIYTLIFYDTSSSYLEGNISKLAMHGYSRDKRPDKKQINYGLVVTEEGFPINFSIFPGNTSDKSTVEDNITKLKDFGLKNIVFVIDRGMKSKKNLDFILDNEYNYIVCLAKSSYKKRVLKVLEEKDFGSFKKEADNLYTHKLEAGGLNYIICYNPVKNKVLRKKLETRLEKAEIYLSELNTQIKKGRIKSHEKIVKRYTSKLRSSHILNYFDISCELEEGDRVKRICFSRKAKKVEEEQKLCGVFVIESNLLEADIGVKDYKKLQLCETAFKMLKSNIKIRPIYHYLDKRIKSHLIICYMSLLLELTIEYLLKQKGENVTFRKVITEMKKLRLVEFRHNDKIYHKLCSLTRDQKRYLDLLELDVFKIIKLSGFI